MGETSIWELRYYITGLSGGGVVSLGAYIGLHELADYTTEMAVAAALAGILGSAALIYVAYPLRNEVYRDDPESRKQRAIDAEPADIWVETEEIDSGTLVKVYDSVYAVDEPAAYFMERDAVEWAESVLDEVETAEVIEV